MFNTYTVKKTINGVEYTAQFSGISAALQSVDSAYIDGTSNTSLEKHAKYLFEHGIVEPRVKIEDFGKDKVGEVVTKEIGGVTYEARFSGILTALKALDSSYIDGTSNTSIEKFARYLFENIITKPENLTVDDFENMEDLNEVVAFAREAMEGWGVMDEFNEVVAFARDVMQGHFRDKAEKQKPANKKSKE